jgi:hypothetical protein
MAWYNFSKAKKEVLILPIERETVKDKYEKFYGLDRVSSENLNQPLITERFSGEYIFFGNDNLYPNLLNNLFYASPFHASIINFKNEHIVGNGYDIITAVTEQRELIAIEQMKYFFDELFINQMGMDYNIHNRLTWKIYWNPEHTKIINIERIEPAKVRATKKVDGKIKEYLINDDWTLRLTGLNQKEYIPAFDTFNKSQKVQLWVWQGYSPGLEYYCQPSYASSVNWLYLDGQISYFHKSNIENSINPSMVMKFYEKPANMAEQQEFVHNLKRSFTSARNAGKVLTFFSNSKEESPDIQVLEANKLDEAFITTQETIIKNIAYAHSMNPIILGVAQAGSLGAGTEYEAAYTIFKNTYVKNTQETLNKILTSFFKMNNLNAVVKLKEVNVTM